MSQQIELLKKALSLAQEAASRGANGSLEDLIEANMFDINKKPIPNAKICWINGELVGSKGNVLSFTGAAKSRKTVVTNSLIASALSGNEVLGIDCKIGEGDIVLHIDTEQGHEHYWEGVKRTLSVAGKSEVPSNFKSVFMRPFTTQQRFDSLDILFKKYKPTICVIDGIRDLLMDFNSNEETSKVISEIMRLSHEYNALIVCVIHITKTHGNMRGALGTALEDKSETVIKVEKDGNKSKVFPIYSRHKDFEPFEIEYNEQESKYIKLDAGMPEVGRPKKAALHPEEHQQKIYNAFKGNKLGYKAMIEAIKQEYSVGDNKAKEIAKNAIADGIIYNNEFDRTYQYSTPF